MVESFMNPKCSVRKTAMPESVGDIESIVRDDTISPDFKIKFLEMIQENKELRAEKASAKTEVDKEILRSEKAIAKAEAEKAIAESERAKSELRSETNRKYKSRCDE